MNELGIPVWVMEPLRGGKLAHLAPQYEAELKALRPDEEIAAWAFRFLRSTPGRDDDPVRHVKPGAA